MKLPIANEFHAEMISRLMAVVINKGTLTKDACKTRYDLGTEMSERVSTLLLIKSDDAVGHSRMIDFVHDFLNIRGKSVVVATRSEAVSH